jgi:hypothetical protein
MLLLALPNSDCKIKGSAELLHLFEIKFGYKYSFSIIKQKLSANLGILSRPFRHSSFQALRTVL